mmetsp:Transcript_67007/g.111339  ORF Transcript_67007/g.111339 Transcript_67007/m.111339 type:complete len:221 (-) Transcript_67007:503-1165(-)
MCTINNGVILRDRRQHEPELREEDDVRQRSIREENLGTLREGLRRNDNKMLSILFKSFGSVRWMLMIGHIYHGDEERGLRAIAVDSSIGSAGDSSHSPAQLRFAGSRAVQPKRTPACSKCIVLEHRRRSPPLVPHHRIGAQLGAFGHFKLLFCPQSCWTTLSFEVRGGRQNFNVRRNVRGWSKLLLKQHKQSKLRISWQRRPICPQRAQARVGTFSIKDE